MVVIFTMYVNFFGQGIGATAELSRPLGSGRAAVDGELRKARFFAAQKMAPNIKLEI